MSKIDVDSNPTLQRPLSHAMAARLASPGNRRPPPISLPKIACLSKSIEPDSADGGER
jgi:hypothetical protein